MANETGIFVYSEGRIIQSDNVNISLKLFHLQSGGRYLQPGVYLVFPAMFKSFTKFLLMPCEETTTSLLSISLASSHIRPLATGSKSPPSTILGTTLLQHFDNHYLHQSSPLPSPIPSQNQKQAHVTAVHHAFRCCPTQANPEASTVTEGI